MLPARSDEISVSRKLVSIATLIILLSSEIHAITSLDVKVLNETVVFFFAADSDGHVLMDRQVGTGFLLTVPRKTGGAPYWMLVTARHVVDPDWMRCPEANPDLLYLRVNKMRYDPRTDETGLAFIPVKLVQNGRPVWSTSSEDFIDVAVLTPPAELVSGEYDVRGLNFRNFGKPEEIAMLGIGSQTASTGLVPGLEGAKRNNPVFHFGKIASIPDEVTLARCTPRSPPRPLLVWWIATTLVPGTSGSPIYFDPLFPPGADVTAGEPRAMLIGLQSVSVANADLAGMTPGSFIVDVLSHSLPADADLNLGLPPR